MTTPILTPMLVQYLIGLCCLRSNPDAVDVTIGDMVYDPAAEKERDVDVTVTIAESGNLSHAFMAYEVKRERSPLDVGAVEQLCLKLLDMPSVTHRAIVSASGYTTAAQTKASRHGIDLYELKPWTRPLQEQFPAFTMQGTAEECFPMSKILLCWVDYKIQIDAREAKAPFMVMSNDQLVTATGEPHGKYQTFAEYQTEISLRSTEILFQLEPATTLRTTFPIPFTAPDGGIPAGPAWPHTHTLDVSGDAVHFKTDAGIFRIDLLTFNGYLHWRRSTDTPLYYVIEKLPNGEAFAGALISPDSREGHMTALVFSAKTREIGINMVRLAQKHLNCIRRLKLEFPGRSDQA